MDHISTDAAFPPVNHPIPALAGGYLSVRVQCGAGR